MAFRASNIIVSNALQNVWTAGLNPRVNLSIAEKTNVVEKADLIDKSVTPMSMRIGGVLLLGLARIVDKKCRRLERIVIEAMSHTRMWSGELKINISRGKERGVHGRITLSEKGDLIDGFDGGVIDLLGDWGISDINMGFNEGRNVRNFCVAASEVTMSPMMNVINTENQMRQVDYELGFEIEGMNMGEFGMFPVMEEGALEVEGIEEYGDGMDIIPPYDMERFSLANMTNAIGQTQRVSTQSLLGVFNSPSVVAQQIKQIGNQMFGKIGENMKGVIRQGTDSNLLLCMDFSPDIVVNSNGLMTGNKFDKKIKMIKGENEGIIEQHNKCNKGDEQHQKEQNIDKLSISKARMITKNQYRRDIVDEMTTVDDQTMWEWLNETQDLMRNKNEKQQENGERGQSSEDNGNRIKDTTKGRKRMRIEEQDDNDNQDQIDGDQSIYNNQLMNKMGKIEGFSIPISSFSPMFGSSPSETPAPTCLRLGMEKVGLGKKEQIKQMNISINIWKQVNVQDKIVNNEAEAIRGRLVAAVFKTNDFEEDNIIDKCSQLNNTKTNNKFDESNVVSQYGRRVISNIEQLEEEKPYSTLCNVIEQSRLFPFNSTFTHWINDNSDYDQQQNTTSFRMNDQQIVMQKVKRKRENDMMNFLNHKIDDKNILEEITGSEANGNEWWNNSGIKEEETTEQANQLGAMWVQSIDKILDSSEGLSEKDLENKQNNLDINQEIKIKDKNQIQNTQQRDQILIEQNTYENKLRMNEDIRMNECEDQGFEEGGQWEEGNDINISKDEDLQLENKKNSRKNQVQEKQESPAKQIQDSFANLQIAENTNASSQIQQSQSPLPEKETMGINVIKDLEKTHFDGNEQIEIRNEDYLPSSLDLTPFLPSKVSKTSKEANKNANQFKGFANASELMNTFYDRIGRQIRKEKEWEALLPSQIMDHIEDEEKDSNYQMMQKGLRGTIIVEQKRELFMKGKRRGNGFCHVALSVVCFLVLTDSHKIALMLSRRAEKRLKERQQYDKNNDMNVLKAIQNEETETTEVQFSRMAKVGQASGRRAARLFYVLLGLQQRDLVRLEQPEAYGEISVRLGDAAADLNLNALGIEC